MCREKFVYFSLPYFYKFVRGSTRKTIEKTIKKYLQKARIDCFSFKYGRTLQYFNPFMTDVPII